jgi:hypothetical protein
LLRAQFAPRGSFTGSRPAGLGGISIIALMEHGGGAGRSRQLKSQALGFERESRRHRRTGRGRQGLWRSNGARRHGVAGVIGWVERHVARSPRGRSPISSLVVFSTRPDLQWYGKGAGVLSPRFWERKRSGWLPGSSISWEKEDSAAAGTTRPPEWAWRDGHDRWIFSRALAMVASSGRLLRSACGDDDWGVTTEYRSR